MTILLTVNKKNLVLSLCAELEKSWAYRGAHQMEPK